MRLPLRAFVALFALLLACNVAFAQDAGLATERDRIGYMVGMDVGRQVAPAMPDMDLAAFQRAMENAMAGGQPLLDAQVARQTGKALMDSVNARASHKPAVAIDRTRVGLLVGADIGRSLADIRGEFDMPMFLRGLQDAVDPAATPLLDETAVAALRGAFAQKLANARAAKRDAAAEQASRAETEFLARNKAENTGVFVTPSGLQYKILEQGDGVRPRPGQRVRVNYQGALLDGTVFDSSYARGQPAEFGLDQVIAGWREGVGMMPVGGKYRFWIPARLGYGAQGTPDGSVPSNATLVFDVELLGVE